MKASMDDLTVTRATELFSALSHPVRLRMTELLCARERTVGQIAEEVSIGRSGASQHLAILARAGIVVSKTRGTSRIYSVRGPRIGKILELIEQFCHVHHLYGPADERVDEVA